MCPSGAVSRSRVVASRRGWVTQTCVTLPASPPPFVASPPLYPPPCRDKLGTLNGGRAAGSILLDGMRRYMRRWLPFLDPHSFALGGLIAVCKWCLLGWVLASPVLVASMKGSGGVRSCETGVAIWQTVDVHISACFIVPPPPFALGLARSQRGIATTRFAACRRFHSHPSFLCPPRHVQHRSAPKWHIVSLLPRFIDSRCDLAYDRGCVPRSALGLA